MPATISTPPAAWIADGSSPSAIQANSTANSTSVSPTNDDTAAPSTRAAPIPATYETTAATRDRPITGTIQLVRMPAKSTSPNVASIGIAPTAPSANSRPAPAAIPPAASETDGSPASTRADSTKYAASPTAAARPQTTPSGSMRPAPVRFSTSTSPSSAV